jgi:hypothetical protein
VLAEKHEEMLENWFFNLQSDELTLEKYLCVDELKFCCETGYFGKNCSPCPAIQKSTACFGRGKCMVWSTLPCVYT